MSLNPANSFDCDHTMNKKNEAKDLGYADIVEQRAWYVKKDYMSRGARHLILREVTDTDDVAPNMGVESPGDDITIADVLMIVGIVVFTVVMFAIATAFILWMIETFG